MTKRSYNQYCGIAVGLDLLGERWTLLIVRNLLMGPKRFKDLLDGLPGIGTGLLTQRLKQLDAAGVITKATLPPPAGSAVYQLTEDGQSLRPVLLALARWGISRVGEPNIDQHLDAESLAFAIEARFDPNAADNADGSYALNIDGRSFRVDVENSTIEVRTGQPEHPRASITTSARTLIALTNGTRTLTDSLADRTVKLDGELESILPIASAFQLIPI